MPGRRTPPIPDRLSPQWAISAFTSVWSGLPGAGWTTRPGRLVDDQQVGVLEEDVEIERLGRRLGGLRLGNIDGEALAFFDLAGRLFYCRSVSQRHAATFDQRFHAAAREGRKGSRQRTVQPLAGGAVVDGHEVAAGITHGVFVASPSLQTGAPLWLKVLVIVMGLLIVAGFVVIAAEVARRMSSPNGFARQRPPPSPNASRCPRARR